MFRRLAAVGIVTAFLMTAIIYTSPSVDSIYESNPPQLMNAPDDSIIIFPKGGGYEQSYWIDLQSGYSVVEASINLIGLDAPHNVQPGFSSLVSTDLADGISKNPQVATDIYYNHYVIYEDTGAIDGSKSGSDIFVSRYDSQSSSWQQAYQLSHNGPFTEAVDPAVTTDNMGNIYVVWSENGNSLSTGGPDSEIFYSKWDGTSWTKPPIIISNATLVSDSTSPDITVDIFGNIYIAWVDNGNIAGSGTDNDIICARFDAKTLNWNKEIVISTDSNDGDSIEPAVTSYKDSIYISWSESGNIDFSGTDYDIFVKSYSGSVWNQQRLITFDINDGESRRSSIAANETRLYIAWHDDGPIKNNGNDFDIVQTYFDYSLNSFGSFNIISDSSSFGTSINPDIVLDSKDNLYIAWTDNGNVSNSGTDWDIFYRVLDKLELRDPVLLTDHIEIGNSVNVSLTSDFKSNVRFVWEDSADLQLSGSDQDIFIKDILFDYRYPVNPKLDIGDNGVWDWNHIGTFSGEVKLEGNWLGLLLTTLVENGEDSAVNGYVNIPFKFYSDSTGAINISHISTRGTATPDPPENLRILDEDVTHVVNHKPTFAWDFVDPDSSSQGRFEVEVGTAPGANDMWDPAPSSDSNTSITYLGANLADGESYFMRVRTADSDGSSWSDWSQPLEFRMNSAPVIKSLSPMIGSFDREMYIEWSGMDAEGDSLIYFVKAYLQFDQVWKNIVDGSSALSYNWDTSNINEQTIGLQCYAYDGYENSSVIVTTEDIYIGHNTPPKLQILSPKVDILLIDSVYLIEWSTEDEDGDKLTISLYYDEDNDSTEKHLIVENYSDRGYYQWDTTNVPPGEYYIAGVLSDGLVNVTSYSDGTIEVGLEADEIPPIVTFTYPGDGEDQMELTTEIRIRFNKDIDQTYINHETLYLMDDSSRLIEGDRVYYPNINELRFKPKAPLKFSTKYTLVLSHSIRDLDGLFLDSNHNGKGGEGAVDDYSFSFSTLEKGKDITPPHVLSTIPARDAREVDILATITINFSEPIDGSTLTDLNFFVIEFDTLLEYEGKEKNWLIDNSVEGIHQYKNDYFQAVFKPLSPLKYNTTYVVILMPQITDLSGNQLIGKYGLNTTSGLIYPDAFYFTTVLEPVEQSNEKFPAEEEGQIFEIIKWEYFYYLFIILLIIVILIATILIRRRVLMGPISIRDVFIIYNDGRLLYHYRPKNSDGSDSSFSKDDIDESAVSSMLTAIQDFVKDSFKFTRGSSLNELQHGMLRILIEHGKNSYVAVVCSGGPTSRIREEMRKIVYDLNVKYGPVLKDWDGNMNSIAGIDKLVVPIIYLEKDVNIEND